MTDTPGDDVQANPRTRRGPITLAFHLLATRPTLCLMAYAIVAFVFTHIPPFRKGPPRPEPLIGIDKLFHFGGFAIYAVVLANVLGRRMNRAATVATTLIALTLYSVVDELTQPPFGRTADAKDWIANMIGVVVGLLAYRVMLRHKLR